MRGIRRGFSLVVAEKNKVARAIANILLGKYRVLRIKGVPIYTSEDYVIMGVSGHILNLDFLEYREWRYDTLKELFSADVEYRVRRGAEKYVRAIEYLARYARRLYLALDNDIEGEHICWEVLEIVRRVNPYIKVYRIRFSSLDPNEVRGAFSNPTGLNEFWIEKSATRQEVDLRSGVIFTRLLTLSLRRKMKLPKNRIISYGPCQSPTLRLIVEPFLKWRAGEKYRYVLRLMLEHPFYGEFTFTKSYNNLEEAERAKEEALRVRIAEVVNVKSWVEKKLPPKPLDAYELASRAAKFLKLPSRKTMSIAEELYRNGFISYPRTETQIYRGVNLRRILSRLINYHVKEISNIARELLSQKVLKPREGKIDDKAHPPIHPIRATKKGELSGDYLKLYELIVRHFLATLMPPAKIKRKEAHIKLGNIRLNTSGLKVIEPGYFMIYYFEKPEEREVPFSKGDKLYLRDVKVRRVKVKPKYLTESELIRIMRAKGIGTDSTMHEHIQTNIERGYAFRSKGKLIPTPLGVTLIESLLKVVPELVDVNLRSNMEREFSLVGEGKLSGSEVVKSIMKTYYDAFHKLESNLDWVTKDLVLAFKAGKVRPDLEK